MAKLFDKIIFNIAVILFTLFWVSRLVSNTVAVILITLLFWIITVTVTVLVSFRLKRRKSISPTEMEKAFAVAGNAETAKRLFSGIPESFSPTLDGDYLCFNRYGTKYLVFVNYGFSPLSAADAGKAFRKASEVEADETLLLGRLPPRAVFSLLSELPKNLSYYSSRKVHRLLKVRNLLPEPIKKSKKKRSRPSFRELFEGIFIKKRGKLFLSSACVLTLCALLSPLKIYYAVTAGLSLLLAIGCYVFDR